MKSIKIAALFFTVCLFFSACRKDVSSDLESASNHSTEIAQQKDSLAKEDTNVTQVELRISDRSYSIDLYDTKAAQALWELLPLEVSMQELNGNEKYVYLPETLPTDEQAPKEIHTGDLMLYGSDCLVLFYKDFSTSYRYTPLGRIQDVQGLQEILGTGNVSVIFQKNS